MRKLLYTTLFIGLVSPILFSCNDFLDKEPTSDLTDKLLGINSNPEDSIKIPTAVRAEQLLGGAYGDFTGEFWQLDWYIANDGQADNAYAGEAKEQTMQFDELRLDASNYGVQRDWGYIYGQIAKTNTIIQWVPLVPDPALTGERKNQIVAEASFIRALCYFNLVRLYGEVPLSVKEIPAINVENLDEVYPMLYPPRVSVDSIYIQIIKDLEYATQYAIDYSADKFKVTKPLANFLLAQVYATKDGFQNTDWSKVKQYSKIVVDNSNYGLMDDYNAVFSVTDPNVTEGILPSVDLDNENCKESLFEVNYTSWSALGNWGAGMFYGIDWKKFNTPSHDLVTAFERAGDDVRKNATIKYGDVTGKWADRFWPSNNYPYCYKLRSQEKGNIVLFRLAEAILLLAEAENESGNTAEAKRLLNMIRTRVKLSNTTANSQSDIRLAIENEHRLEFAFEGKRWFDLVRRGRAIQVMKACTDHQKDYANMHLNENRLIWPIPQSERDQNSFLTQNPGY